MPGLFTPVLILAASAFNMVSGLASVPPALRGVSLDGTASLDAHLWAGSADVAMALLLGAALLAVTLPRRLSLRVAVAATLVTIVPLGVVLTLSLRGIAVPANAPMAASLSVTPLIVALRLCRTKRLVRALLGVAALVGPAVLVGAGVLRSTTWWTYWAGVPLGNEGGVLSHGELVLDGLARWVSLGLAALGLLLAWTLVTDVMPQPPRARRRIALWLAAGLSALLLVASAAPATGLGGNWAGYVAKDGPFHRVTATWTQPGLGSSRGSTSASYWATSFWVGLDGAGTHTVEQIGTTLSGDAWYEMYPKPQKVIRLPVSPGDVMRATVTRDGAHRFRLELRNVTTGDFFATTQVDRRAGGASAEVIAESAWSPDAPRALPADFGHVMFSEVAIDGQPLKALHPGATDIASHRLARLTTTSTLKPGGTSFSVTRTFEAPSAFVILARTLESGRDSDVRWVAGLSLALLLALALMRLYATRGGAQVVAVAASASDDATAADPASWPPAWYADPLARHQYRYWDGAAWTSAVADDGLTTDDPLSTVDAEARRRTRRRLWKRVLWCLYAVPFAILLVATTPIEVHEVGAWAALDIAVSLPMLLGLYLYVWDKRLFAPPFWRVYAVFIVVWDVVGTVALVPAITHTAFVPSDLVGGLIELPAYVALFLYAYRRRAN